MIIFRGKGTKIEGIDTQKPFQQFSQSKRQNKFKFNI
jgi:hypothetical protein